LTTVGRALKALNENIIINPHGVSFQKTAFFIVTAVKISNPTIPYCV
jgi:hypothetical protein